MNKNHLSFPFSLDNLTIQKIISSRPGAYDFSNPWTWKDPVNGRSTVKVPSRISIELGGQGLYQQDGELELALSSASSYDPGLAKDYTAPATRAGVWLYIYAYGVGDTIKYLISDVTTGLSAAGIQDERLIEAFFCYTSDLKDSIGDQDNTKTAGDIDLNSFESMTGPSMTLAVGAGLPSTAIPQRWFYSFTLNALYFSMKGEWVAISQETLPKDLDFMIGKPLLQASENNSPGVIDLPLNHDGNNTVKKGAFPKWEQFLGAGNLAKWGGDGVNTVGIPAVEDFTPKEFVTVWEGEQGEVTQVSPEMIKAFSGETVENGDRFRAIVDYNDDSAQNTMQGTIEVVDLSSNAYSAGYSAETTFINIHWNSAGYFSATQKGYNTFSIVKIEKEIRFSKAPAGMKYVIYLGGSEATEQVSSDLVSQVAELEAKLGVMVEPYKTVWTAMPSWTGQDIIIEHPFKGAVLDDLDIRFLVSPTGKDSDSLDVPVGNTTINASNVSFGSTVKYESDSSIRISTASTLAFIASGHTVTPVTDGWYYRATISYKKLSPISQANYYPVKDWVEVEGFTPVNSQKVTFKVPDGEYKAILTAFTENSTVYEAVVLVDSSKGTNAGTAWEKTYNLLYSYSTGEWNTEHPSYKICKLFRKQDSRGYNQKPYPLHDGIVEVWNGDPKSTVSKDELSEFEYDSMYLVELFLHLSSGVKVTNVIYIASDSEGVFGQDLQSSGSPANFVRAYFNPDGEFVANGVGTYSPTINRILRFTGMMSQSIDHRNINLFGENGRIHEIDTTSGPVNITTDDAQYFPPVATATEGYLVTLKNGGDVGQTLTIQTPWDTMVVTDHRSISLCLIDGEWTILTGHLIQHPEPKKDWVTIWEGSQSLVKLPEPGVYKVWGRQVGSGDEAVSMEIDTTIGDFQESLFVSQSDLGSQIRLEFIQADMEIKSSTVGSYTSTIVKVQQWKDATGNEIPAVPIKDASTLVYEDQSGVSSLVSYSSMKHLDSPIGDYIIEVSYNGGGEERMTGRVRYSGRSENTHHLIFLDAAGNGVFSQVNGTGITVSGNGAYQSPAPKITRVWKVQGFLNLNYKRTNSTVVGNPEKLFIRKDTSGGAIDISAEFPSHLDPAYSDGDIVEVFNSAGFDTDPSYVITGCPDGIKIGAGGSCRWRLNKDNNCWMADKSCLIHQYKKTVGNGDWIVRKTADGSMVQRLPQATGRASLQDVWNLPEIFTGDTSDWNASANQISNLSTGDVMILKGDNSVTTLVDSSASTFINIQLEGYWALPSTIN